jgi:hypothetical protein
MATGSPEEVAVVAPAVDFLLLAVLTIAVATTGAVLFL